MTTQCPDADCLVALAEGRLPTAESRVLEAHIAECSLCGLLVADLDASSSTDAPTVDAVVDQLSDAAVGLPLEAGEMAGRYRISRVIGQGAMGVVYEAEDPRLARRIAVKALKVSAADAIAGATLREEGRSLGQLQHPHVVPVFDVGSCRLGWFIAMEFVEGEALEEWCKSKPWRAIVDRFAEAAEGLAAAHRVGIVHRDFKPSNVLVGSDNRARVADFGIAVSSTGPGPSHTVDGSASGSGPRPVRGTATQSVVGTPAYMAPEQLLGEPATPRSDQFAFFVSLFAMLEGKRPFSGTTPQALLASRYAGPDPHQRNDLPDELRELIAVGLRCDPEQRHGSMSDVAAALRMIRAPKPKRWRWAAAGGLGLAAAAALTSFSGDDARCESAATAFESTWRDETRPALRARWDMDLPHDTFTRLDQRVDGFARRWATEFAAACAAEPAQASATRACLRRRSTQLDAALEVSMHEETPASRVMDVMIAATPGSACTLPTGDEGGGSLLALVRPGVIDGWNARARSLYAADRYAASKALLVDRWDAIERFGTPEQRAQAQFVLGLNELYATEHEHAEGFARITDAHAMAMGAGADELVATIALAALAWAPSIDPEAAETWTRQARVDTERAGDPRLSAKFYLAVGSREHQRGRTRSAAEAAEAASAILQGREDSDDLTWQLEALRGHIEMGKRDYDVALIHYETALDQLQRWRGPRSTLSVGPRAGLIQAMLGTGDVESAAIVLDEQEAVVVASELDGAVHRNTTALLRSAYFGAIGDQESAHRVVRALARRVRPGDRRWADAYTRLGLSLLRSRDFVAARDVFERVRVHQEAVLGSGSYRLAITLHNLAEAESGIGELDRAGGHYREALSIAEQSEAESPMLAYSLTGLGEVELRQGHLEIARELLTRALTISHDDEAERAETRLSLARTLWRLGGAPHQTRALELADQAAAAFDQTPGYDQQALELSHWRETL